jgi:hypothetical protein
MGTKLSMSTAFHPQTDRQTERSNRTLEQMLRNWVNYKQDDWDEHLAAAEFACNNAKQTSTGVTPFFANTGQDPSVPVRFLCEGNDDEEDHVQSTEDFVKKMSDILKGVTENLSEAQDKQKKYADQHRRDITFQVGDKVLLSTKNIQVDVQKRRPSRKFLPRFIGPFEIIQVVSPTSYKLALPDTMKIHPVFHVSLLKAYKENPEEEFPNRVVQPPPPIVVHDELEYEVEKILDKRIKRQGHKVSIEYLVKWKGYPDYDATWEPQEALKNAPEVVEEFIKSLEDTQDSDND